MSNYNSPASRFGPFSCALVPFSGRRVRKRPAIVCIELLSRVHTVRVLPEEELVINGVGINEARDGLVLPFLPARPCLTVTRIEIHPVDLDHGMIIEDRG